jgi:hypothetical protein
LTALENKDGVLELVFAKAAESKTVAVLDLIIRARDLHHASSLLGAKALHEIPYLARRVNRRFNICFTR